MDLGQLLGDLGGAYIKYKYGGQALARMPAAVTQPVNWGPGPIQATPAMAGVPGMLAKGAPYIAGGIAGLMMDEFGNLVERKKKRRRRRRLATASDLRDLAALQGILGKGVAFTTWIATHSH